MEFDVTEFKGSECIRKMVNYAEVCREVKKNKEGQLHMALMHNGDCEQWGSGHWLLPP